MAVSVSAVARMVVAMRIHATVWVGRRIHATVWVGRRVHVTVRVVVSIMTGAVTTGAVTTGTTGRSLLSRLIVPTRFGAAEEEGRVLSAATFMEQLQHHCPDAVCVTNLRPMHVGGPVVRSKATQCTLVVL